MELATQIETLESSPAAQRLGERVRLLLRRALEELAPEEQGLTDAELVRRLKREFPAEFLDETVPGAFERHGFFRRLPSGNWGLADTGRLEREIDGMPICVFDVEATGGRPPLHRIVELGFIRIEPDGTTTRFESLVNPGRPLPPYISYMTGLKQPVLDAAPRMDELLPTVERFLDGAILVAHDVSGDMELLSYELFRARGRLVENPIACTVAMTRALRPALERSGLEAVAKELGIAFEQKHRALGDAEATVGIWKVLREDLAKSGARTLADLTFFQGQISCPLFLTNKLSVERLEAVSAVPGLFELRDTTGRRIHLEAAADLRQAMHGLFYPRHRLPPFLKKLGREAADFELKPMASLEEARAVLRAEGAGSPRRAPPSRGRRRRH